MVWAIKVYPGNMALRSAFQTNVERAGGGRLCSTNAHSCALKLTAKAVQSRACT